MTDDIVFHTSILGVMAIALLILMGDSYATTGQISQHLENTAKLFIPLFILFVSIYFYINYDKIKPKLRILTKLKHR